MPRLLRLSLPLIENTEHLILLYKITMTIPVKACKSITQLVIYQLQ